MSVAVGGMEVSTDGLMDRSTLAKPSHPRSIDSVLLEEPSWAGADIDEVWDAAGKLPADSKPANAKVRMRGEKDKAEHSQLLYLISCILAMLWDFPWSRTAHTPSCYRFTIPSPVQSALLCRFSQAR